MFFVLSLFLGFGRVLNPFDAAPGTPLSAISAPALHIAPAHHASPRLHTDDAAPGTPLN